MLKTLEGRDLQAWMNLGDSIKNFQRSQTLKRSQTFDHSKPVLDSPDLKLSLSIQHFNKEKTLRRRQTIDKSSPPVNLVKHSHSIQNFDSGTLRHVDLVDKSSPMYMYSLAHGLSGYSHYLDTPLEGKDMGFSNCDIGETESEQSADKCEGEESLYESQEIVPSGQVDNTEEEAVMNQAGNVVQEQGNGDSQTADIKKITRDNSGMVTGEANEIHEESTVVCDRTECLDGEKTSEKVSGEPGEVSETLVDAKSVVAMENGVVGFVKHGEGDQADCHSEMMKGQETSDQGNCTG